MKFITVTFAGILLVCASALSESKAATTLQASVNATLENPTKRCNHRVWKAMVNGESCDLISRNQVCKEFDTVLGAYGGAYAFVFEAGVRAAAASFGCDL